MPLRCVGLNSESTGEPAEVLGWEVTGSNGYLMEIDVAALCARLVLQTEGQLKLKKKWDSPQCLVNAGDRRPMSTLYLPPGFLSIGICIPCIHV